MADIDQKVQISIEADASHFRREIEKIRRDIAAISGQGTRVTPASAATKRISAGRADKRTQSATLLFESRKTSALKKQLGLVKQLGYALERNERISRRTGGGGGGGARGARGRGGRALGGMLKMAGLAMPGGMAGMALGTAATGGAMAIGATIQGLIKSYGAFMQTGQAKGRLVGMGMDPGRYAAGQSRAASMFGVGPTQFAQTARAVTSRVGGGGAAATMRAVQMQRATGMDTGATANLLGTLAQAGQGFGGKAGTQGQRELETVMTAAFSAGLDRARVPEFLQGVNTLVRRQGMVSAGDVSARGAAMLLTQLGQSGLTGFRGERGARVAANLDETIRRGGAGAGAAGKSFMLRAFGFGAGGGASYVEALRRMEKGVSDPTNVKSMLEQVRKEYGTGEAGQLALSKLSGGSVSLSQAQGLFSMLNKGGLSARNIKEVMSAGVKKSLSDRALESMDTTFGEVASHTAKIEELLVISGERIAPPIMRMQEMLVEFLPPIAEAVALTATSVEAVANLIGAVTAPVSAAVSAAAGAAYRGEGGWGTGGDARNFGRISTLAKGTPEHAALKQAVDTSTARILAPIVTGLQRLNSVQEQTARIVHEVRQQLPQGDTSGTRKSPL